MIVAFDGNVYTGKTTLIKLLAEEYGYNSIDEHSLFVDLSGTEGENYPTINVQERYIQVDTRRRELVRGKINLLDRSFVSVSAHVYALFMLGIEDVRSDYLSLFQRKIGEILIPDMFTFVHCGYDTSQKRCLEVSNNKKTEALLLSREYFEYIGQFNEKWISMVNGHKIETQNSPTKKWIVSIHKEVLEKIPVRRYDTTGIFQMIRSCMEK